MKHGCGLGICHSGSLLGHEPTFNRTGGKLFYYAVKLNKFFVLGSKSCQANLNHLYAYWTGTYKGKKDERIKFGEDDKQNMMTPLFQTLFLLVPVISSTFASVGRFLKDVQEGTIGMLVIDEAGQAQPQMALGALYRSRRAIIVGDPRQVEPVVTDDLKMLRPAFSGDLYVPYKENNISVQKCADLINPYGNYLEDGTRREWVGSPLVVHRRCISPMYDISNAISYNGIMKQQTMPPKKEKEKTFVRSSCWINTYGSENGHKNHYNKSQGKAAEAIVFDAFKRNGNHAPSLFVITPFNSVRTGIIEELKNVYSRKSREAAEQVPEKEEFDNWLDKSISTVHKFQGKEADQVIFLLGCDRSKEAEGAVSWVKANIVNVAVTRAKYRLYIIGDAEAWKKNEYVSKAKAIIDTYVLKEIADKKFDSITKEKAEHLNSQLPGFHSFPVTVSDNDEADIETSGFLSELDGEKVYEKSLTDAEVAKFGFQSAEELKQFDPEVQKNLEWGIKLFNLLKPIYCSNDKLDASVCAILFCKALELHVKSCMMTGLKALLPDFHVKGQGKGRESIPLSEVHSKEMTLGTFSYILKNNHNQEKIGEHMKEKGEHEYNAEWWNVYEKKLQKATSRRNNCCHAEVFLYSQVQKLIDDMFEHSYSDPEEEAPSDGLMFASEVGKRI